jgi:hypothetical protein
MSKIEQLEHQLTNNATSENPDLVLDALEQVLIESNDFHRLFDAKLMRVRQRMGLPLTQPASLSGIPASQEAEYRDAWIAAARDVGQRFLEAGKLSDAWAYFRTIDDPEPVQKAIEAIPIPREQDEAADELLHLALHDGAHIVRGLQILLETHGTCNTVTAVSQLLPQMTQEERRKTAQLMVDRVYSELLMSLKRDVERRQPILKPDVSVSELMAGRDWLFEDGNYHIDVSHLHSTVAFARHLTQEDPQLQRAIELSQYGSQLAENLQYPADVPFDQYYEANGYFLKALAGIDVDAALKYFEGRLQSEPDQSDQRLIAFVLIDLARRVDRIDDALTVAAPILAGLEDANGFSFTACCVDAGRLDLLEATARDHDDVLAWTVAQLSEHAAQQS